MRILKVILTHRGDEREIYHVVVDDEKELALRQKIENKKQKGIIKSYMISRVRHITSVAEILVGMSKDDFVLLISNINEIEV